MKYFLELFSIVFINAGFIGAALIHDIRPMYVHTYYAFVCIGWGWLFFLAIFAIMRYLSGGYGR